MKRVMQQISALALLATLTSIGVLATGAAPAMAKEETHHVLLLKSATENADLTQVTLPIFEGKRSGRTVWHVITESSDKEDAMQRKVHYSPKLASAKGTNAIERAEIVDGMIVFKGTVSFAPKLKLVPGPTGFPPAEASPGAVGDGFYTPLIELPDGTVLNAPHIENSTGDHDRLVSIDHAKHTATFRMTKGFFEGKVVHYVSFNASDPGVATIEAVNYTPKLGATPTKGVDAPSSALIGLIPFANGQTGKKNPQRQGLSSALLGEGDPMNIVQEIPAGKRALDYSPMWDAHLAVWTQKAIDAGLNVAQKDFNKVAKLAKEGYITGPGGAPWGPIGVVVNCPIISIDE